MPTCGDIITRASTLIHGGGSSQDRVTAVNMTPIGPADYSFTATSTYGQATGITAGLVEIDSELVYVTTVDATTGICQVAPFGRGYLGTTAVSHAAGARIVSRPKFPRVELFTAVNDTLGSLYPDLFAVATFTGTVNYNTPFPLPSNARTVLAFDWLTPTGEYIPVNNYRVDRADGSISVDSVRLGATVRIVYATEPTLFGQEADNFTMTGLPPSCVDLLVWGAVVRTVPGLDISRAQTSSVEASSRSTVVPPNAGLTASKYLQSLFDMRLTNERRSLRSQYPTRIVRTV